MTEDCKLNQAKAVNRKGFVLCNYRKGKWVPGRRTHPTIYRATRAFKRAKLMLSRVRLWDRNRGVWAKY